MYVQSNNYSISMAWELRPRSTPRRSRAQGNNNNRRVSSSSGHWSANKKYAPKDSSGEHAAGDDATEVGKMSFYQKAISQGLVKN